MSVDDIAAQGAEPLFFLDYISIGKLVPEEIDEIVAGVAEGCRQRALRAARRRDVGASRACMEPGEFDLVGFAVGVVERADGAAARRARRRPHRRPREPGSAVQRLLARARRAARARRPRPRRPRVAGRAPRRSPRSCCAPSVIYAPAMLRARSRRCRCTRSRTSPAVASPATSCGCCPTAATRVVSARHVGRAADLRRDPARRRRRRRRDGARVQPRSRACSRSFAADDALTAVDVVRAAGHDAWLVGEIVDGHGRVQMVPAG